ncbi:ribonuclease P protein component [Deinococcus aerophilus]|uniref:Ribonuclease P protein component n=1 Tax=Deinococcus aerophilus TaxID=522488 RepID=A0ABQ2GQC4_9DEIO|nr:ribonuclease P protein component [Deinococcus aerophilus]
MALDSLRGDREFRKVRNHGVAVRDPLLTVRVTEYRPRYGEAWRPRAIIGIVVSKKTLRRAVDRNRARRRVREALRTLPGGLPPCRAIVLPNPGVLSVPFEVLQATLTRALSRAPGRAQSKTQGAAQGKAQGRKAGGEGNRRAAGVSAPVASSPSPDASGATPDRKAP